MSIKQKISNVIASIISALVFPGYLCVYLYAESIPSSPESQYSMLSLVIIYLIIPPLLGFCMGTISFRMTHKVIFPTVLTTTVSLISGICTQVIYMSIRHAPIERIIGSITGFASIYLMLAFPITFLVASFITKCCSSEQRKIPSHM